MHENVFVSLLFLISLACFALETETDWRSGKRDGKEMAGSERRVSEKKILYDGI